MKTIDLYEEGFPHGTVQGFDRGCHGSACPGLIETGISCARANQRYAGDYNFRHQVDSGLTPAHIVKIEEGDRTVSTPPNSVVAPKPAAPKAEAKPFKSKHGTAAGYSAGCRDDNCPGVQLVGKSCRQAVMEYQRDLKARKATEAAAAAGRRAPAPRPVPLPLKEVAVAEPARVEPVVEQVTEAIAVPDMVNHPPHYRLGTVEVIDLTEQLNFCRGNAVKYIARAGMKDPSLELEDLQKAAWYLEREIQRIQAVSA